MYEDLIRYDKLIDSAMRFVVKEALKEVCNVGLKGDHHFLLSFITDADGVEIPKTLKERYPNEMTIVIQHQFENLIINDDRFSVTLSFDGKKEAIVVPFMALTSFADPGVKFGLKFNLVDEAVYLDESKAEGPVAETAKPLEKQKSDKKSNADAKKSAKASSAKKKAEKDANVVVLDSFRANKD
jgi:hypothetical protein